MRKIFILTLLIAGFLHAQVDTAWVRRYHGTGNTSDYATALAIDNQGNVYVTGYSNGSGSDLDYATVKYNSAGVQQWVARYNGIGNYQDRADAIAVDTQGNVYVTGHCASSTYNMDYVTIKYNSNGDTLWVRRYDGPGNDADDAYAIAVDTSGNVYVTGQSYGSGTLWDYATIKYNSAGAQQWVARYNNSAFNDHDIAYALALDGQGNVYVTGRSNGTSGASDIVTIKYNSAGIQQWLTSFSGPGDNYDWAKAIAVDSSGIVYVTGTSSDYNGVYDYITLKYNLVGTQLWAARYNGPANSFDEAYAVKVDNSGNVYVTGYSGDVGSGSDFATIKYNSLGVQQWVERYNGPANLDDGAYAMAIDMPGNIYVTGYSKSSSTSPDYLTIKYNSAGAQQWSARYNGPANNQDFARAIAVDSQSRVYVTGESYNAGTFYDYTTIKYVQSGAIEEIKSCKLSVDNFSVFPNPAKTFFNVRSSLLAFPSSLKLFDVSGKQVKSKELSVKNCRVSLDGIKNGVYFVRVNGVMVKEKLVVTK